MFSLDHLKKHKSTCWKIAWEVIFPVTLVDSVTHRPYQVTLGINKKSKLIKNLVVNHKKQVGNVFIMPLEMYKQPYLIFANHKVLNDKEKCSLNMYFMMGTCM